MSQSDQSSGDADRGFRAVLVALACTLLAGGIAGCRPPASSGGSDAASPQASKATDSSRLVEGVALHPGTRPRCDPAHGPTGVRPRFRGRGVPGSEDWVLGLTRVGMSRAYPLWILSRHEIVNDRVEGEPVCVTYCPLSGSAVVFDARVRGREITFGNEGALFECDLVLYDRTSRSLWYQLRGEALQGEFVGESLPMLPATLTTWGEWLRRHPTTTVLVGDEKMGRFFRVASSGTRDETPELTAPAAPVSRDHPRFPAMTRVIGFRQGDLAACVTESSLSRLASGPGAVPGVPGLHIHTDPLAGTRIVDAAGREVPAIPCYWFAWYAAFPGQVLAPDGGADRH